MCRDGGRWKGRGDRKGMDGGGSKRAARDEGMGDKGRNLGMAMGFT